MIKNHLVSIIVPIYNVELFLSKCIDSIINQDYKNLEIILVCDGSPDSSLDKCKKYSEIDNRIIVINKNNGGVSSARNHGVRKSSGDYIIFVDADDWLEKNFVSYMVSIMDKSSCDFGLSLNAIKNENSQLNECEIIQIMSPTEATALLLSTRVDVGCWNKIYRRDLLIRNKLYFNEKQYYGEGLLFITTASQLANKIIVTNKALYHYRQNNKLSATKKYNFDKYINGIESLDLIKENLKYDDPDINKQLNIHYCLFYCNAIYDTYINKKINTSKKQYNRWKKEAKKYFKIIRKYKETSVKRKVFIILVLFCPSLLTIYKNLTKKGVYEK